MTLEENYKLAAEVNLVIENIKKLDIVPDECEKKYKSWLDTFAQLLTYSNIYQAAELKKAFPKEWAEFGKKWA